MARHSGCVVSYTRSALLSERDQYPIGFAVLSGCSCNNTHLAWTSQASSSSIICPSVYGSTSTSVEINFSWKFIITLSSVSFSSKLNCWSFHNLSFNEDANFSKFDTNRLNKLHTPSNNFNSITCLGVFRPLMASVVCNAISRCLGWIIWLKKLMFLVEKIHFYNFRATPAVALNLESMLTWPMCFGASERRQRHRRGRLNQTSI